MSEVTCRDLSDAATEKIVRIETTAASEDLITHSEKQM